MNRILHKFKGSAVGSLFILKIIKAKPEGVELHRWLELIFGLHERDIIQYESNRTFVIPGLFKPAPQIRVSGFRVPRTVSQHQRIWVRFDLKYPNVIDFEAPIAHGNESKLFQLTRKEWDHVKMWLDPVHRLDRKFHKQDCEINRVLQHKK